MTARYLGRYLAILALVAVLVATAVVVRAGIRDTHHRAKTQAATLPSSHRARRPRKFYVIRPGDSLSTISVKTGVPVATLEALNPSVDQYALQAGQRLKLR